MLNNIIIGDMVHFLTFLHKIGDPGIPGLSNSNGNPIEQRWDVELPKITNVGFYKKKYSGECRGYGDGFYDDSLSHLILLKKPGFTKVGPPPPSYFTSR